MNLFRNLIWLFFAVGLFASWQLCRAGDYQAESVVLFARMTTAPPDADTKYAIDSEIRSLKKLGLWDTVFDAMWFFSGHDQTESKLDWIGTSDATELSTPTWTIHQGFLSNGALKAINTNFQLVTDATNYALTDASFAVYSRTDVGEAIGDYDMGCGTVGGGYFARILIRRSDNLTLLNFNNNNAELGNTANSLGLFVGERNGAVQNLYKNGVAIDLGLSRVATTVPDLNVYIGGWNSSGTLANPTAREWAFAGIGKHLTTQQHADLFTCIEAWMDYWGTGVVAGTTEFPYPSLFSEETEVKRTFELKHLPKLKSN